MNLTERWKGIKIQWIPTNCMCIHKTGGWVRFPRDKLGELCIKQSPDGNAVQCPVYFGLLWYSTKLVKKCLSLPANFLVVKLTWIGFEFSRSSSSPPASFWSGGGSCSFLSACCCCYEHHHISSYPDNRGMVDCFLQDEWNCCLW